MPVLAPRFTPLQPRRGGLVHASSTAEAGKTVCGLRFTDKWVVSLRVLTCRRCKLAMHLDCRRGGREAARR